MSATIRQFRKKAKDTLEDSRLQIALEDATGRFREARVMALNALEDAEGLRDHLKKIRGATIANLAEYLEAFESNADKAGAKVHWAINELEATRIVVGIAQAHNVNLVVKSKSMTTEEIRLNHALTEAGITPVETDLGEWIVQLADESPSHIIAPAIHKTKEQVAVLFEKVLSKPVPADIPALTLEARGILRERFLAAEMGISGANLGVAETGSIVIVTNEGNGRMVTSLPPVHVVVMGIEKIAPTWDEAAVWLALLARNATGQPLSIYTNIITGPAQSIDPDGPQEVHIVLLDNNRSKYLGTEYEEVLSCIRCGACLNVCPVYREAGGHAYGSPYSGPIGAVISPLLFGLKAFAALPQACSLCGACLDVCPVRIDIPRMVLSLRRDEREEGILPIFYRLTERWAGWVLSQQKIYERLAGLVRWLRATKIIQLFIKARLPELAGRSFREMWERGDVEEKS